MIPSFYHRYLLTEVECRGKGLSDSLNCIEYTFSRLQNTIRRPKSVQQHIPVVISIKRVLNYVFQESSQLDEVLLRNARDYKQYTARSSKSIWHNTNY